MPDDAVTEDQVPNDTLPPRAPGHASAPRVRTLLICDLVDSTALVERLGDVAASELLRRHDRLARDLLHGHNGREIDKTDGFLALFDRPIEAVAFALAYQRALRTLGDEEKQMLRARVGVHVGEVVVWENNAVDIAGGAKRLDVEGLAKPVVARLMALALPGQIILSGIAFTLAQRAERELERAATLRWLTHGRYRFKGVAAPMLVHEVGEVGVAPLQAPPSGAKAQKEVPLWRKPGVIALEAIAVLIAIAVPIVLTLRAPPAIAFGERDWIVMGELRNLTGESVLDESLSTAFRISMEQSRYVNVLPDLKLRDALARMQRPPDTAIDRAVASEIAIREGARAVILPTVAEIGGRVRVSAEVIDPHTQTTVYAESADGVGAVSTLDSIDTVTHELRAKLGEALSAIEQDSAPLPKVTSGSLDALRAYALAERAYAADNLDQAQQLYAEALRLDPEFALALIGSSRVASRHYEHDAALEYADRALTLSDRLTPRDALYLRAYRASWDAPAASIREWTTLTRLYPDYLVAFYNLASREAVAAHLFAACAKNAARIDVPQFPYRADAVYLKAMCELGQGAIEKAVTEFERSKSMGVAGFGFASAAAFAASRDFKAAWLELEGAEKTESKGAMIEYAAMAASFRLDTGDFEAARSAMAGALTNEAAALPRHFKTVIGTQVLVFAAMDGIEESENRRLQTHFAERIAGIQGDPREDNRPEAFQALVLALVVARQGQLDLAERAVMELSGEKMLEGFPLHAALLQCVQAELERQRGRPEAALRILPDRAASILLLQQWAVRVDALASAGRHREAGEQAEALAKMRGRAYSEIGGYGLLLPINVATVDLALLQSAEASAAEEDREATDHALRRFAGVWPEEHWPESIRTRVERVRRP